MLPLNYANIPIDRQVHSFIPYLPCVLSDLASSFFHCSAESFIFFQGLGCVCSFFRVGKSSEYYEHYGCSLSLGLVALLWESFVRERYPVYSY